MEQVTYGESVGGYPGKLDLYVYCGDTFIRRLRFFEWNAETKEYDKPVDISGYTYKAGMRYPSTGYTAGITCTYDSDDVDKNCLIIQLDPNVTVELGMFSRLNWDLQFTKSPNVKTVLSGYVFPITENVS